MPVSTRSSTRNILSGSAPNADELDRNDGLWSDDTFGSPLTDLDSDDDYVESRGGGTDNCKSDGCSISSLSGSLYDGSGNTGALSNLSSSLYEESAGSIDEVGQIMGGFTSGVNNNVDIEWYHSRRAFSLERLYTRYFETPKLGFPISAVRTPCEDENLYDTPTPDLPRFNLTPPSPDMGSRFIQRKMRQPGTDYSPKEFRADQPSAMFDLLDIQQRRASTALESPTNDSNSRPKVAPKQLSLSRAAQRRKRISKFNTENLWRTNIAGLSYKLPFWSALDAPLDSQ